MSKEDKARLKNRSKVRRERGSKSRGLESVQYQHSDDKKHS